MGSRNIDIDQHREAREFSMHPRQFVIKSIIHRIRCSPPHTRLSAEKIVRTPARSTGWSICSILMIWHVQHGSQRRLKLYAFILATRGCHLFELSWSYYALRTERLAGASPRVLHRAHEWSGWWHYRLSRHLAAICVSARGPASVSLVLGGILQPWRSDVPQTLGS